ncbi:dihydrolipoyl dehydrogenase [Arenibacterium halophilum]|uniref:Dihydrolipoyl dehydrogenase n=1 Tax=Arenibacterium halophilum TaxID=2583821 RepID=A0ABY2WZA0_9RHOB|nr:dihydrolipoyl dehydrogenase [Arenibacterium halophilum]TMV08275.1 dihydrolipoyl dehydrogenase [Arenibacterium halophilum]
MTDLRTTLLVIGGGPGGYVCASRAARLGVDTMLVERDRLGGTCLNVGCIPSKALIHAADLFSKALRQSTDGTCGVHVAQPRLDFGETRNWMDGVTAKLRAGVAGLLEKSGVKSVSGHARFLDGKTVEVTGDTGRMTIHAEYIVIASGSRPVNLPGLPTGGRVLDSTAALALTEPPSTLGVIGAGYIGLELGTAFAKLGTKVTLVEAAEDILPQYDSRLTRPVRRRLSDLGITLKTGTRVEGWDDATGTLTMSTSDGQDTADFDKVLVTIGRTANTDGLGLEELSLRMDGGLIHVDDRCTTSMRGVHAIGDVTPGPMLAHRAIAQAEVVADVVAGHTAQWDRRCVPEVCFTDPEIVSVGLSPEMAEAETAIEVSEFPFRASGRAMTLDDTDGFVRLVCRASDHVILGVQATGPGISELAGSFAQSIEAGLRAEDISATIHPHPTLSEAYQEAALGLSSIANHG